MLGPLCALAALAVMTQGEAPTVAAAPLAKGGRRRAVVPAARPGGAAGLGALSEAPPPPGKPGAEFGRLTQAGLRAYQQGQYAEAMDAFERAYGLQPLPILLYNLGSAQRKAGRHKEGCDSFRRFVEALPKSDKRAEVDGYLGECRARGEVERAESLLSQKDYAEAAKAFRAAYEAQARGVYLCQAAEALRLGERVPEALSAYQGCLASGPLERRAEAEARISELSARKEEERARELLSAGRFEQAAESFRAVYRLSQRPAALLACGAALRQARRLREATSVYERIPLEHPQAPERREAEARLVELRALLEEELAEELSGRGEVRAAARSYEKAYAIWPEPLFLYREASTLRLGGQGEAALPVLQRFNRHPQAAQTGLLPLGRQQERELREVLDLRRELAYSRRPPVWRRPWFLGVMTGAALLAGVGVGLGIAIGADLRRPMEPMTELGPPRDVSIP